MKTINEQREMIMRFADRDKDDRIRKEELGLFFSESRRVQGMDAKGGEASKDSQALGRAIPYKASKIILDCDNGEVASNQK